MLLRNGLAGQTNILTSYSSGSKITPVKDHFKYSSCIIKIDEYLEDQNLVASNFSDLPNQRT